MSIVLHIRAAAIVAGIFTAFAQLHAAPVRFLAWDDAIAARKISFSDGTNTVELQDLHPHKRSRTINWTSGEIPPVLVARDRNSADGKPITAPVKLTPDLKSPLVLILPDPAHASGLRCFVIDEDSSGFGWGTLRFINATGKELLIRQDKEIKTLPETWKAVDIKPGGATRNIGIQMASRADLTAILYSAVWEFEPDVRKLIIVVPGADARTGAVDLKIIPEDRRSVAPPASPNAAQTP
jgi:hypothetical protein